MRGFRDVREKTYIREKCPWPRYSSESDNLPKRLELPDDSGDLPYGCTFRMELPDDSGDLPCPMR